MKILVIDNDSERIGALKSLACNGHLTQVAADLSEVKIFLDQSVCQILVLGPDQVSGDRLQAFTEWRDSLGEKRPPCTVALGSRQGSADGIDHFFQIPFDEIDVIGLPGLSGVPPEPEVMDRTEALEICDKDEGLLGEIVNIFINDGPKRIEKLTQGMNAKDWKVVMEAAHLLKGSSLNLAAESFRFVSQNLERAGAAGNTPLIFFWFDQVVYEYGRLENYLKGQVEGPASLS